MTAAAWATAAEDELRCAFVEADEICVAPAGAENVSGSRGDAAAERLGLSGLTGFGVDSLEGVVVAACWLPGSRHPEPDAAVSPGVAAVELPDECQPATGGVAPSAAAAETAATTRAK